MEPVKIIFVGSGGHLLNVNGELIGYSADIEIAFKCQEEIAMPQLNIQEYEQDYRGFTQDERNNEYRKHVLRMTGGRRRHNGSNKR